MSDAAGSRSSSPRTKQHLAQILSQFLRGRGYARGHACADGRAALESLRAEAFDVALLDIVMPELDGLEVLKQVRAEPSRPRSSSSPATAPIETAISAMKLGAYDYMAKPYRMAEIDVLVRRAWEKRSSRARTLCCSRGSSRVDATPRDRHAVCAAAGGARAASNAWRRAIRRCSSPGESGTGKALVARDAAPAVAARVGPFVDATARVARRGHARQRAVRA